MVSKNILPLSFIKPGEDVIVEDYRCGRGMRQRLTVLGLVPNAGVRVVNNDMIGPLIISVGGGRLAIGRGMAQRILVSEKSNLPKC